MCIKSLLRKLDNEIHSSYSAPLSLEDDLESGLGSGSGDWDEQDGDCELTCAVVRAYSWQLRPSFCRKYYLKSFEFFEVARRFDDSFDPLLRKRHRKLTFAWPLQSSRFHVGTMGRLTRSLPHLTNGQHHLKIELGVFAIIFGLFQVIMPSKIKLVSAIWR